jgi:hypothetical protein
MKKKPGFYFAHHFMSPDFSWSHYSLGFYIGRVKEMGNDIVWNIYMPWFSFGYAW